MQIRNLNLKMVVLLRIIAIIFVLSIFRFPAAGETLASDSLYRLGKQLYEAGKYSECIPLFEEVKKLDYRELSPTDARNGYAKQWLASAYHHLGNDSLAKINSISTYMFHPADRDKNRDIDSLFNLCSQKINEKKSYELPALFDEIRQHNSALYPEESLEYALNNFSLMMVASAAEKMYETITLAEETEKLFEKLLVCASESLLAIKANIYFTYLIPTYYTQKNKREEIFEKIEWVLEQAKSLGNDELYLQGLIQKTMAYFNMFDMDKAADVGAEIYELVEDKFITRPLQYVQSKHFLGKLLQSVGEPKAALKELESANQYMDEHPLEERNIMKWNVLYLMADINLRGNPQESLRLLEEAKSYLDAEYENNPGGYLPIMMSQNYLAMAQTAAAMGKGKEAEKYQQLAQQVSEPDAFQRIGQMKEVQDEQSAGSPSQLLWLYIQKCNQATTPEELLSAVKKCEEIVEQYGLPQSMILTPLQQKALIQSSMLTGGIGNIDRWETIWLLEDVLELTEQVQGKENFMYIQLLGAQILINMGYDINRNEAIEQLREYNELLTEKVLSGFLYMTSEERFQYWNALKNNMESIAGLLLLKSDVEVAEVCYNMALFTKGLLLNADREWVETVMTSKDIDAKPYFERMHALRQQMESEGLTSEERAELKEQLNAQEKELIQKSKDVADYTKALKTTYKDVCEKLKEDEVAVEFISMTNQQAAITYYFALVTSSDSSCPYPYLLFTSDQLKEMKRGGLDNPELSQAIWGRFDYFFNDHSKIYFSPVGELYNIPIESLPAIGNPDKMMSEVYEMHRLSSTRELVRDYSKSTYSNAHLFGGLDFDAHRNGKAKVVPKPETTAATDSEAVSPANTLVNKRDLNLRGNISQLPGSLKEVEDISKNLKKSKVRTTLRTDKQGTEAEFKQLSGKDISILHIATHGFFWTETDTKLMDAASWGKLFNGSEADSPEERALARSGLAMTGANAYIFNDELYDGENDGLVTAKEIARMNLSSLDLAVLSACQTGLGDITGEGVWGLQRGLKKAGAKSILMSLWKVDDKATSILMERFYRNLIAGQTKYKALVNAQRFLRDYEKDGDHPYKHPKYWAAFILLDSFN